MSKATDLLNGLTDEQLSLYSTGVGEEPHIIIDENRFITVPDELKRIAVQFDHNIETVTFDCPRYWDNNDLSAMKLYINYILPDGTPGSYIVNDVTAEGSVMHFTWTVSSNVTREYGNITFLVCAKKTEGDKEINHWNTELCRDMYVSEGLNTEEHIAMENTDLITQLLLRMDAVEKINVQAGEMQTLYENTQAVADTAEVVKNEALDASDYIKNSYAPAIKGKASGEIVRVDDVSPIEHDVRCRVRGKNLVNVDFIGGESSSDRSIIQKDGDTIVFPALDGNVYGFYMNNSDLGMKVGKTYTASIGSISAFNPSSYGWRIRYMDGTTATLPHAQTVTFTVEKEIEKIIFRIGSPYQGNTESRITDIQIEEGPVATEYEPYLDPTTVTVSRCGKNLFDMTSLIGKKTTMNGVTVEVLSDGCIYAHGTPIDTTIDTSITMSHSQKVDVFPRGTYVYGNNPRPNDENVYCFPQANRPDNKAWIININKTPTYVPENFCMDRFVVYVKAGTTKAVNAKFYLQVELGGESTGYEKYQSVSTIVPSADGFCDIASVYPTTMVFAPGATVDIEYNRDTTKVMESYVLTDETKAEMAEELKKACIGDIERTLDEIIAIQDALIGDGEILESAYGTVDITVEGIDDTLKTFKLYGREVVV